jgi:hypothetical protein
MPNTTFKANPRRLTATFKDDNETVADPTAVIIRVCEDPGTTITSYLTATGFTSQGNWDASANSPALANSTGTAGHWYTVTVAGSVDFGNDSITFAVGDRVYYNGDEWLQLENVSATAVTKVSTGIYRADIYPRKKNAIYTYSAEGIGDNQAFSETYFTVQRSKTL